MRQRAFVLQPLLDIEPKLTLPNGNKLAEYLEQLDRSDIHYHSELSLSWDILKNYAKTTEKGASQLRRVLSSGF